VANIIFDVGHPAHVHLFKQVARRLAAEGHKILFTALDREMILTLLDCEQLPYEVTYKRRSGRWALILELALRSLATYRIARRFQADLFLSMGNPTVGLPARLLGKPYIALTDTEHATEQHMLFTPLATVIATPTVFTKDMGPKQERYAGFHELAYLHPDEFTADPAVLAELDLTPESVFFVLRFVAWQATHDIGQKGFTLEQKRALLRELAQHGQLLLSVEGEVDAEFAPYVTRFAPEKIHHFLAFATLYVGEGATTASEAAVLGTPCIYVNMLGMGYISDLRDRGLLFHYRDGSGVLEKIRELLALPDLKLTWAERRAMMLGEKIDTTQWLLALCRRYLG
jgi:predicted glycosyltransferase